MSTLPARPSRATVIACLALFMAMASPVAAAVMIKSNAQVAPDTIAGHAPPAGAHSNLIADSVDATDLAPAVNAGLAAVPSSVVYRADALFPQTYSTIGTAGDITVEASCIGAGGVLLWLYVTTPSGAAMAYSVVEADHQADPSNEHDQVIKTGNVTLAAGRQRFLIFRENNVQQYARLAGTFMFRTGNQVVQLDLNTVELDLNAVANFDYGGAIECTVDGTLTAAR